MFDFMSNNIRIHKSNTIYNLAYIYTFNKLPIFLIYILIISLYIIDYYQLQYFIIKKAYHLY